ncbi:MAG: tryptophan--tRNA ligase [Bacillota bacterium]|nr:tryptophan--tRNA ligase [Bacillota bacterium]
MPRVFSGVQPTGALHIGNYLGALRQFEAAPGHLYCIVDWHAITEPHDPALLREGTLHVAAAMIALGLHEGSTLFVQSHVPAHMELMWYMTCTGTMGELQRMTQFKAKAQGRESVSVGLFAYPLLMAADILLYRTEKVPVGEDQKQHVELTRDLAERFNSRYGKTFVLPEAVMPPAGARVRSLTKPTEKMSKSDPDPDSKILLLDSPDDIRRKIKRAVTDTGREIRHDPEEKPGISNLLEIQSALTGTPISRLEELYAGKAYREFKEEVAEAVVEGLRPLREKMVAIASEAGEIERILQEGARKAAALGAPLLEDVRRKLGFMELSPS